MPGKDGNKAKNKLTAKQEAFCREYVIDWNGTRAALKAGYSKKTADRIAYQNLKKLEIQNRIAQLTKKAVEKQELTLDDVINELKTIAFNNATDYFETDYDLKSLEEVKKLKSVKAISGIKKKPTKEGYEYEIRFADKIKALESLKSYFIDFEHKKQNDYDQEEHFRQAVYILENTNE